MILALKLTLAPLLVALASIVAQRFGPAIAGLLTGFPIVGGPIFLFLVAEHGQAFGVQAAAGALFGLIAWAAFTLCYIRVCRIRGWLMSLSCASVVFLVCTVMLSGWNPGLAASALAGAAVPIFASMFLPVSPRAGAGQRLPRAELAIRMIAAGLLVLAITELAVVSGPTMAGLLAAFPIVTGVLAAFSQRLYGPGRAIEVLRGSAAGLYGYVVFFTVAALTLSYGLLLSCGIALTSGLLAQALVYRFKALPASRP